MDFLVEQARRRLDLDLVDATDFDQRRAGMSPNELFDQLCRLAPDDKLSFYTLLDEFF